MQHRTVTCRRGLIVNEQRLITRFEEWRPSPWRGDEPSDETERRLLRGVAGGHPPAGKYRSTRESFLTSPAVVTPPRGPFFAPPERVRRKKVPFVATVVGVGLTALIAALCLGIAIAPVWVHALILAALR